MKRQVRRNVFETNSSSMHSLVVKKESSYYDDSELRKRFWMRDDGTYDIWDDDNLNFGRSPFECLGTFEGKVRYAIASLCSRRENASETFNMIANIVYEMIPECKKIKLPVQYYDDKIYYGSVDEDILTGFLKSEGIALKEFLINKKYIVIIDGDEYCIWDDIKKCGLVNRESISSEYPVRNCLTDED